MQLKG